MLRNESIKELGWFFTEAYKSLGAHYYIKKRNIIVSLCARHFSRTHNNREPLDPTGHILTLITGTKCQKWTIFEHIGRIKLCEHCISEIQSERQPEKKCWTQNACTAKSMPKLSTNGVKMEASCQNESVKATRTHAQAVKIRVLR